MVVKKPKLKALLAKLKPISKKQAFKHDHSKCSEKNILKSRQQQQPELKPKSQRYIIPFSAQDTILLIGEGNFSFALGLATTLGSGSQILATTNESIDTTQLKYPDAQENVYIFTEVYSGQCLYDLDGTRLDTYPSIRKRTFTKIVFMFPHVGKGIKDQDRNILDNQKLVLGFLQSCVSVSNALTEIILTVKTGGPYDEWNVKKLAKSAGLACKRSFAFSPESYPGYEHRRTLGHDSKISSPVPNSEIKRAKTYIFTLAS